MVLRRDLLNPTLIDIFETFKMDKNYVFGQDSYLVDEEGIRYLDFIAQYGAIPFGYNPDFVWEKLQEVREKGIPSLVQPSLPGEAVKLANMLAECTPGDLCYCTFCQSGTEAVEAAIKLARSTTGREIIISTTNSFHGKTLGSLSATGKDSYQKPFRAPAPGFIRIPYNDVDALNEAFNKYGDNIAGFIVEPVQGEGGIILAQPGYLGAAQKICNEHDTVFIIDEIQTGLGRTGRLFACEYEGIEPDIMLVAKALGGGILPIGVCISSSQVWNDDFGMLHSSTFANNNVTCAVGTAVLDKLLADNQEVIKGVAEKGDYLLQKLSDLALNYPDVIKEVRGKGLMAAIEFNDLSDCGSYDMSFITDQGGFTILLAGFLLNVYNIRLAPYLNNSMTLRLEPTLTIAYEEIDYVINALEMICKILHYRDYSRLYRYVIGDYTKPEKLTDYRPVSRETVSSDLAEGEQAAQKFAFIVHYPAPEDVILNNPSFTSFTRDELYSFLEWQSSTSEPGVVCHMPAIKSSNGDIAEGWMIGVPYGARELMNMPKEVTVESITKAVDMGRDLGAKIVGLGALTSVVTRGGRAVQGRDVAITSGNSFTTLMAMEALFLGAQKMHMNFDEVHGAVIGATGSIGRACAIMLAEQVRNITLFGNPNHVTSSKNRLQSLMQDMFAEARTKLSTGLGVAGWLTNTIDMLQQRNTSESEAYSKRILSDEAITLELIEDVCQYLGINCPVKISFNIEEALPQCDMIVAASNSPEYLIYPRHLCSGAVVCDVARPADVAPECYQKRDDVLVLEGGLVQYPDNISFGPNLGYRNGVSLGCLSETVLLALEGDYNDYSIGMNLSLETIDYLRHLGKKHGFSLAGLKMGNREISDEEIEEIYQHSIEFKKAENL